MLGYILNVHFKLNKYLKYILYNIFYSVYAFYVFNSCSSKYGKIMQLTIYFAFGAR